MHHKRAQHYLLLNFIFATASTFPRIQVEKNEKKNHSINFSSSLNCISSLHAGFVNPPQAWLKPIYILKIILIFLFAL